MPLVFECTQKFRHSFDGREPAAPWRHSYERHGQLATRPSFPDGAGGRVSQDGSKVRQCQYVAKPFAKGRLAFCFRYHVFECLLVSRLSHGLADASAFEPLAIGQRFALHDAHPNIGLDFKPLLWLRRQVGADR